jgi:hypothetical protein
LLGVSRAEMDGSIHEKRSYLLASGKEPFETTRDGDEVDLVYEGAELLPAEIKLAHSPSIDVIDAINGMKGLKIGFKRVICTTQKNVPLQSDVSLISAWDLF